MKTSKWNWINLAGSSFLPAKWSMKDNCLWTCSGLRPGSHVALFQPMSEMSLVKNAMSMKLAHLIVSFLWSPRAAKTYSFEMTFSLQTNICWKRCKKRILCHFSDVPPCMLCSFANLLCENTLWQQRISANACFLFVYPRDSFNLEVAEA